MDYWRERWQECVKMHKEGNLTEFGKGALQSLSMVIPELEALTRENKKLKERLNEFTSSRRQPELSRDSQKSI
jgi:regulator of replication initiation timing